MREMEFRRALRDYTRPEMNSISWSNNLRPCLRLGSVVDRQISKSAKKLYLFWKYEVQYGSVLLKN